MGTKTEIQWTDHTFNPWWGYLEVSPGCDHCFARELAHRFGRQVWVRLTPLAARPPAPPTGVSRWHGTIQPRRELAGTECSAPVRRTSSSSIRNSTPCG